MREVGTVTPKNKILDDVDLLHDSASLALPRATQMPLANTLKLLKIPKLSGKFTNRQRQ